MAYTPLYTSEELVEGLLQVTITTGTNPSTAEVLVWIEEVESGMVELRLGSHTETDHYITVPGGRGGQDWSRWHYVVKNDRLMVDEFAGAIIPLHTIKGPVISVTTLSKNDESLDSAPSWTELTQWDGSSGSTDFVFLYDESLGHALYIYDDAPTAGYNRLKMTYSYGYNLLAAVLQEYATLKVGIKVLEAREVAADPVGVKTFSSPNLATAVNTESEGLRERYELRCMEIEVKHFPKRKAGIEVI